MQKQDKASGMANQAVGKSKAAVGKILGNEKLQAEGKAQDAKGSGQEFIADAKKTASQGAKIVGKKIDQVKDALKK